MEQKRYTLTLNDFSKLHLVGVREVSGFDEALIELSMGEFNLLIGGQNLKIECFSQESGELSITGTVDSILRETETPKKSFSLFSGLFR